MYVNQMDYFATATDASSFRRAIHENAEAFLDFFIIGGVGLSP
jgi:hypothetical protein